MAALKALRTAGGNPKLGGSIKHNFLPPFIDCRIQPEQGWRFGFVPGDHQGQENPRHVIIESTTCLKHAVAVTAQSTVALSGDDLASIVGVLATER
ncbi:hypothetical protein PAXRUDRAFT_822798 [Paxillus rubicundulus Ve08.2h10]|uniref:Uncharacterized protein n=1 Tax=Paxillus rubicundulus Ve08.2h10 TaxID=930991 RepID=A0A0D0E9G6_9AGAM|nr:hypothetical protein PAXRUDRAFT_822798 [Paxillus rubicundulus Ve08.2h10]